jgi:DNA repair protein RecN (Recombination protein N)
VLTRIELRNLALVQQLDLDLGGGLIALTGETGAGKSTVVEALHLLAGGRASSELLRSGADHLLVTAWCGNVALSRRVSAESRSVCRVDGEVVGLRELAAASAAHFTVYGQGSAGALGGDQAALLDRCSPPALRQEVAGRYRSWADAAARLRRLEAEASTRESRAALLAFEAAEIDRVGPVAGEERDLEARIGRLRHYEAVQQGTMAAAAALSGEPSAEQALLRALRELGAAARHDATLAPLLSELESALQAVRAVGGELADRSRAGFDPAELDRLQERSAALRRLARYGHSSEELVLRRQRIGAELESLQGSGAELDRLRNQVEQELTAWYRAAAALSAARRQAAAPLAAKLQLRLRQLALPAARLDFQEIPREGPSELGAEAVQLRFSANPDQPLLPLERVASGGELSRIMLATCSELGAEVPTLVFDEIDAGLGGRAALSVAAQLAQLAAHHQVLVVTHLAQVAARADAHLVVEKTLEQGRTALRVRQLDGEDRVAELARMLSGRVTEVALRHARELLEARGVGS